MCDIAKMSVETPPIQRYLNQGPDVRSFDKKMRKGGRGRLFILLMRIPEQARRRIESSGK